MNTKNLLLISLFILIVLIVLIKNIYIIFIIIYIYKNDIKIGNNLINFIYIYNEIFNKEDYKLNVNYDNFVIFDIGANMGIFSLWINENFRNTKIHLFEPIDELLDIAKYNLRKMKKYNNEFIFNNVGLSDNNYYDIINYYYYANGLSTINDFNDKLSYHSIIEQVILNIILRFYIKKKIKLISIKKYIINNNISNIDLCKIDVEGFENKVIDGFYDKINIVKIFIIELEKKNLNKITKKLSNYYIYTKNDIYKEHFIIIYAIRKDLVIINRNQ